LVEGIGGRKSPTGSGRKKLNTRCAEAVGACIAGIAKKQ